MVVSVQCYPSLSIFYADLESGIVGALESGAGGQLRPSSTPEPVWRGREGGREEKAQIRGGLTQSGSNEPQVTGGQGGEEGLRARTQLWEGNAGRGRHEALEHGMGEEEGGKLRGVSQSTETRNDTRCMLESRFEVGWMTSPVQLRDSFGADLRFFDPITVLWIRGVSTFVTTFGKESLSVTSFGLPGFSQSSSNSRYIFSDLRMNDSSAKHQISCAAPTKPVTHRCHTLRFNASCHPDHSQFPPTSSSSCILVLAARWRVSEALLTLEITLTTSESTPTS